MYTPNKTKPDFAAAVEEATRLARGGKITFIETRTLAALKARIVALAAKLSAAEASNEDLRKLVAMYQGEGADEIPEETEWKRLVDIPTHERTPEQCARLPFLARYVRRETDSRLLRERLSAADAHIRQLEKVPPERCESIVRRTRVEYESLRGGGDDAK